LDAVESKGIADNTIIFYLSDHGDYAGAHGLWAKGLPCYREAYNICCMVGGAGVAAKGTTCDAPVSLADMAPTILELAGVKTDSHFAGGSLVPFLSGASTTPSWRTELYTQSNGNEVYGIQRAVWNKEWKYVYNAFDYDQLYHLASDPLEYHNVIDEPVNTPVVKEMCRKLWGFARNNNDGCTCPYIMTGLAPYGPGIINL